MAYAKPSDLDGFIALMPKSDMRIKGQLAEDLVNYLSDYENSLYCTDMGLLIDALMPWLTGSHFKVCIFCVNQNIETKILRQRVYVFVSFIMLITIR
jgi:hypothetical protein